MRSLVTNNCGRYSRTKPIGAILVSTYDTPPMVTEQDLALMRSGAVIGRRDVRLWGRLPSGRRPGPAARRSSHVVAGVVHVKLDMLPALVPVTATTAYTRNALPYLVRLARAGGLLLLQILDLHDDGTIGACNSYTPGIGEQELVTDRKFTDEDGSLLVRRRQQSCAGQILNLFILRSRGLEDVDRFGQLPGPPGAAAELAQDAPGLENACRACPEQGKLPGRKLP